MKKLIAILLTLVMVLSLFAGCGAAEPAPETTPEAAEASNMDELIAAANE